MSQLCPQTLPWPPITLQINPVGSEAQCAPARTPPPPLLLAFSILFSLLVKPAFLLFLQHTKLALSERDPDSWSLHLLFLLPGKVFSSSFKFLRPPPENSLLWLIHQKALPQSPSLPWLWGIIFPSTCHFFTLQICSFPVFFTKI